MEDIIEEIVGNIQDEYDEEEEMIVTLPDGTYIVDGAAQLDDLEELLKIRFEEEDYDTINGYIVNRLDHIPTAEEKIRIEVENYIFEVISVNKKTIRKIRIKKNR